ncbi:protein hairy-like [Vespa crabro]|uniref:protein hairy-like n=1 Tax=Vespa crabro TaxID=7445 RepID=UPI001F01F01E|nr:protein hairy-like [Vespa crabro]
MVDYNSYKMSTSEEDFEQQAHPGMTKAELRRNNKPIMEKRRRARINQCLDELKNLILEALKKDPTRHSKLEKADILEMTVKHLQTVQRQQLSTAIATDPAVLTKFRSGFSECATEVSRYVSNLENVDPAVKQRLLSHLNNYVSNLQQIGPFYGHYVPYMPERLYPEVKVGYHSEVANGDENNNSSTRIQIPNGVQLIPSRLPTGELALLVPQSAAISSNFSFFPHPSESISRTIASSAFSSVHRIHSPLDSPSTSTSSYGEENHHLECYPQIHQQPKFKIPEQSSGSGKSFTSSPDTQKAQITSSSDRKSPISSTSFDYKSEVNGNLKKEPIYNFSEQIDCIASTSLRQPLSVITDKTYNRPCTSLSNKDIKRHPSDRLLVIPEKKQKLQDDTPSSSVTLDDKRNENCHDVSAEDRTTNASSTSSNTSRSNANSSQGFSNTAGPSSSNGDMWRPW